jgi:hypothetical protein
MSEPVSKLIPRKVAKQRLGGVSDMTIWRLEQDPDAGFPLPVVINGRCFYYARRSSCGRRGDPSRAHRPSVTCARPEPTADQSRRHLGIFRLVASTATR